MGMYTALVLDARLKDDTPQGVIDVLQRMISGTEVSSDPRSLPDHGLFGDTRWSWMLRGSSAYFPLEREPSLRAPFYYSHGHSDTPVLLSVGFSIKNYDNEIELFIDWLTPYVYEAIGWTMYEENEAPTPIVIGWP